MIEKISSLVGIAQRAGFVISGSNLILREISRKRWKRDWLVLVASDAHTTTGRQLVEKSRKAGLQVARIPLNKSQLGLAIGKNHRGYVMIKDSGIAGRILALLEEMEVLPLD